MNDALPAEAPDHRGRRALAEMPAILRETTPVWKLVQRNVDRCANEDRRLAEAEKWINDHAKVLKELRISVEFEYAYRENASAIQRVMRRVVWRERGRRTPLDRIEELLEKTA